MRRPPRPVEHVAGLARLVRAVGASTFAAAAASTVETAAADRAARAARFVPRDPGPLVGAEPLRAVRADRAARRRATVGVACRFVRAGVEVRFLADDLVRISWGPDEEPPDWALARDPCAEPPGPLGTVKVTSTPGGVMASSRAMSVLVEPDGSLVLADHEGRQLRRELPPLAKGTARTHRHVLRDGEQLVGLGEQAGGPGLTGRHRLWNRDPGGRWGPGSDPLYCVVPVVIGLHSSGCLLDFFENPAEGEVEVVPPTTSAPARLEARFSSGMLRHYVALGSLSAVVERYSALSGRPALPPRWALGYHQSRWGYATEAQVREVARGFRDEGLPLSAVHLDIDHMDGYRVFTVDTERFSDLGGLARDLAARGTRVVAIVDPGVKADPGYDVYASGREHFVKTGDGEVLHGIAWPGRAAFCDFTDPAARRWWGGFYHRLLDAGVSGVWHDMNEPTSLALWGDQALPRNARHAAGDHRRCHNAYGLLMADAGAAALRAARPERRPFVLSRSGWAGIQRHAWIWTGDVETSWAGLRQQVATVLGLGLSGLPFSGPDIGGFSATPTPELYVRWLELAVFLPFCRTHCTRTAGPREPWAFEEPVRSLVGDLVRLRYRLLPYLYTLAEEAARTGRPLVRPPGWPERADVATAEDELLLGDALLVAPVTAEGARGRRVRLPGGEWARCAFLGDGVHVAPVEGRREVLVDSPLGTPPVLLRAGTVLPLDERPAVGGALAPGHEIGLLALHCLADRSGRATGELYDDAGDGDGPHRRHRFSLASGAGGLRVLRWERSGDHPDPERVRVVLHGKAAAGVRADGVDVPFEVRRGRAAGRAQGGQADQGRQAGPESVVATVVECAPFASMELL